MTSAHLVRHEPEPTLRDVVAKLNEIDAKVDDVVARGKKTNSLVGMLVGRFPAPKKGRS
jgi:hypothetical protein